MKKGLSLSFILCFSVALFIAACCPRNPLMNTTVTAHGNTDWHIDTAEEFLFGTNMAGTTMAANHCPDTWTRRHMHTGLSNTNHFYYDKDLTTPGDDTDTTNGIDQAMLFYYAGHGAPTSWDTLGNSATQTYMSLGDCPGGGLLRYYWQCSCEVFAHGPQNCPGETFWYACPGDFDGSADSHSMRNVYERWGPVLEPELRMACGASTSAYCWDWVTNKIWDNYNNKSYNVADFFIDGMTWYGVVPLCLTMGGFDVTSTPLYDAMFTNKPNTSGTSHYHIQYLSHFASTPREPELIIHIPKKFPILGVNPMSLPEVLRGVKFKTKNNLMVSPEEVEGRGAKIRVNPLSGAVYILGERKPTVKEPLLKEKEYIDRAFQFIKEQDWSEKEISEPMGMRFMIATTPVKEKQSTEIQEFQKNVIVKFKRLIEVAGISVNVLGEGGVISVQMNNDGSVLNASKVWREVTAVKKMVRVKRNEDAYKEAIEKIENPDAYKLDRWMWGYKEAAGNMEQKELTIVFRFAFVAADPETTRKYPPQMIEIPGQIQ